MLKYLIVQLDDTSPSFCHYPNKINQARLINLDALKDGLLWAMKENLMVQFIYPDYKLPKDYYELINTVDHIDIERDNNDADVSVFDGTEYLHKLKIKGYPHVILRLTKNELFENISDILEVLEIQQSLNIVIIDVESFKENDFEAYKDALKEISLTVEKKLESNAALNINLLTDRLVLSSMKNCNAGDEHITLAPDGNFYICPAFYGDKEKCIGNPKVGLNITNGYLYKLQNAPICRICDAYQCKRCIWLNKRLTLEVNTPSHEQCVVAHLERNASRNILKNVKKSGKVRINNTIPDIDYLDPFDKIKR